MDHYGNRSIKRLVNSISLIQIFAENKKYKNENDENDEKHLDVSSRKEFLMFSLICLQINMSIFMIF